MLLKAGVLVLLSYLCYMDAGVDAARKTVITIEGRLVYKDSHHQNLWSLAGSPDEPVYKLPGQPLDARKQPIVPGSTISLSCTTAADDPLRCTSVGVAAIIRLAAPVKSTGVSLRMLIMVVTLTGGCTRSGAKVEEVEAAYQRPGGYFDYLSDCSYQKMTYDTTAFKVISTPVACSAKLLACDEDEIAARAYASAKEQLGELEAASYQYHSYVIPDGMIYTCNWVGLAELPGRKTWFTPDKYGIYSKGTVMQETLHNFGIWHGWKGQDEYKDYSTAMGEGNSCPSAPELWRLGWATPMATLNKDNLHLRTPVSFILPATTEGPNQVMIKIQPDWMGRRYNTNVYLGLRVRAAGDVDLLPEFDQKINVHEVNRYIDNYFDAYGDPRVTIIGTIPSEGELDLPDHRLLIRTGGMVRSRKMTVRVCRYQSRPSECSSGGIDLVPVSSSPPSPPPPSPSKPPSPAPPTQQSPAPSRSTPTPRPGRRRRKSPPPPPPRAPTAPGSPQHPDYYYGPPPRY